MIHGFVGAGKTIFSKKLEKEIKVDRFMPDEWISDPYGSNPLAERFKAVDPVIETCVVIKTG